MKTKQKYAELLKKVTRNWQEDFSHENGNYINRCIKCDLDFIGHKRRVICRECAEAKTEA